MSVELPDGFVEMLTSLGLSDAADAISETSPSVSVRLNRRKASVGFDGAVDVAWLPGIGLTLPERPRFTLDPALHQGRYYVQEAGSMFHAYVVSRLFADCDRPLKVLDACAAPGGKTTAVIDALSDGSIIVANEIVPARAAVLRENLVKWGYPGVIVTRGDTRPFARMKDEFDLIVADVPCSGEGMMRKDNDAVAQWSPGLIEECAAIQHDILENLWPALRPGGYLIYSTCTFNRRENEEQVLRFMTETGAESIDIPVPNEWGITGAISADGLHAFRFIPGRTPTEGLFIAALRKTGVFAERPEKKKFSRQKSKPLSPECSSVAGWISSAEPMLIYRRDDRITAFPAAGYTLLERLERLTDVIYEGVTVATVKGRDLIPSQALAQSVILRRDAFPVVPVSTQQALDYLRGNQVILPDSPRGFVLLLYEGQPLGWVKNLGIRSNNLYPRQWRILIQK